MKKTKLVFPVICLLTLLCIPGIQAEKAETSVTNQIETGIVDIDLGEWMIDEQGEKVPWRKFEKAVPGDFISWIPRITNEAVDCYIRVKVQLSTEREIERKLTLDDLEGIKEGWIRRGDYFYWPKILSHGEQVELLEGFTIPPEWDTKYDKDGNQIDYYENNKIKMELQVDAIQSQNFEPDFQIESPWGEVEIQECLHEDGYNFNSFKKASEVGLSVVFEDEAKRLIASPEDFFEGFPTLLPGDAMEGAVTLNNNGKDAELYFKTEILEEKELLEKLELTITLEKDQKSKTLYHGPLNSREITEYLSLGVLKKGEKGALSFHVYVPEELDNAYSLQKKFM